LPPPVVFSCMQRLPTFILVKILKTILRCNHSELLLHVLCVSLKAKLKGIFLFLISFLMQLYVKGCTVWEQTDMNHSWCVSIPEWCIRCYSLASFSPCLSLPVNFERGSSWFSNQVHLQAENQKETLNWREEVLESFLFMCCLVPTETIFVLFLHEQTCFCHMKKCIVWIFCSFWSSGYQCIF
jgi:hypothetical protein